MTEIKQPTSFQFTAQYFDGTDELLTIELSTPKTTPNAKNCKGINLIKLLAKMKAIDNKLMGKSIVLYDENRDYKLKEGLTRLDQLAVLDEQQEINLELYQLIVDELLSEYGYAQNDNESDKSWFNILNWMEIVKEYQEAWQPFLDRMTSISPSQILNISKDSKPKNLEKVKTK